MAKETLSPLDVDFWSDGKGGNVCQFDREGNLIADWHMLRKCYDLFMARDSNPTFWEQRDVAAHIIIGAAIWKARNS